MSSRKVDPNKLAKWREFLHTKYLAEDRRTPALCVITSVTEHAVYYRVDIRPGERGRSTTYKDRDKFVDECVLAWNGTTEFAAILAIASGEWRKGRKFLHSSFHNGSGKPALCTITGFRDEWVLYKTEDAFGRGEMNDVSALRGSFAEKVKEWLE